MDRNIDLVSLPKKSFWKLSIPIIGFCIFDAIYGIVDMLWVSQIGVEAFYAIGISIPITSLIFSFGDSIGQGTNSIISRFIGSGDYESGYNALIHGIIITNILWIIFVLFLIFTQGIIYTFDPEDSYVLIFDYLVPMVFFAYIFMLNSLFSDTFQAEGNSHTPTILIIASNILNIILDPIFIFNLNLGIRGAAYASVLSSLISLYIMLFLYISGRTKIPLKLKYFKLRPYIFIEILKVTLPNFIDDAIWCFSMSFVNGILLMTMGAMGPILYSVSNKIRTLIYAPIKGYGRGLMSVTGHMFGAEKFDELEEMFNYALKVTICTTLVIMIAVFFLRNYAYAIFSITGMEDTIFWIVIGGTAIMTCTSVSTISAKMLDGFGKSPYSLAIVIIKALVEIPLIYFLAYHAGLGYPVLIGIILAELLTATLYYKLLRYLFKNFDKKYEFKYTVKAFTIDRNEKRKLHNEKLREHREKIHEDIEGEREKIHENIEMKKEKRREIIEEEREKIHKNIEMKKEKRREKLEKE